MKNWNKIIPLAVSTFNTLQKKIVSKASCVKATGLYKWTLHFFRDDVHDSHLPRGYEFFSCYFNPFCSTPLTEGFRTEQERKDFNLFQKVLSDTAEESADIDIMIPIIRKRESSLRKLLKARGVSEDHDKVIESILLEIQHGEQKMYGSLPP